MRNKHKNTNDKAYKAIILSRVSSKDQEEGYSLEVQTDRLEKYCQRKGLEILQNFRIIESSTQGDRKLFNEMISFVKKQREPIALVADKVDRVQRRQKETPILDDLVKQGKLELHFNSEGYIIHKDSSAHEMMMWGMGVVIAKSHTDLLSENVKKSFKRKIEVHGEWYGPAPIGYLNKRDDRGRGIIVIDPVRAPIIRKLFEEYATGSHTIAEIVRKGKEAGLRSKREIHVGPSVISRMLENPFYYGEMQIKGEVWPHHYEPIISREIFKACEAVRLSWNRKPFYKGKELLFRGILKCGVTGRVVTGDIKLRKYRNGKTAQWVYLRTWNPDNPEKLMWVREDKIIEQLERILTELKIKNTDILEKTMEYLIDVNRERMHEINKEIGALRQEHSQIQNKLNSLIDLVADGILTREEFSAKKAQLKDRQYEINTILDSSSGDDDKFSKKLAELIKIAINAYETFKSSTIAEKRDFLNFIFANLSLKGYRLDYSLAFPFTDIKKLASCSEWPSVRFSNL